MVQLKAWVLLLQVVHPDATVEQAWQREDVLRKYPEAQERATVLLEQVTQKFSTVLQGVQLFAALR